METMEAYEAVRLGLSTYFTGRPCMRGHMAPRRTVNGGCVECKRITDAAYVARKRGITLERDVAQPDYPRLKSGPAGHQMMSISQADAKRFHLKRFFTGFPCLHGHVAERYVSSGRCLECQARKPRGNGAGMSHVMDAVGHMSGPRDAVDVEQAAYNRGRADAIEELRLHLENTLAKERGGWLPVGEVGPMGILQADLAGGPTVRFPALTKDSVLKFPLNVINGMCGQFLVQQDAFGGHELTLDERFEVVGEFHIDKRPNEFTIIPYGVDPWGNFRLYPLAVRNG